MFWVSGFRWVSVKLSLPVVALLLFQVYMVTKKAEENLQTLHIGRAGVWIKTDLYVTVSRFSSCEQGQPCWMKPRAKMFLYYIKAWLLAACLIPGPLTAVNELYVSQLSKHSSLNDSSECVLLLELLHLHS